MTLRFLEYFAIPCRQQRPVSSAAGTSGITVTTPARSFLSRTFAVRGFAGYPYRARRARKLTASAHLHTYRMCLHSAAIYFPLYVIPRMVFGWSRFMRSPASSTLNTALDISKSGAFLATYVLMMKGTQCAVRNARQLNETSWINGAASPYSMPCYPLRMRASAQAYLVCPFCVPAAHIVPRASPGLIGGFLTGLSIFWERSSRRIELALYCLPRASAMDLGVLAAGRAGGYGPALSIKAIPCHWPCNRRWKFSPNSV